MQILLSWLHEFLPVQPSAEEVRDALTSHGIEVASLRNLASGFENVVVGHVEEARQHPNADRLRLCQVNDGEQKYDIVCGASNVAKGQRIALARIGATLPNGLTIKKTKIRGEASSGMICSEAELGMSDEAEGILVLPEDSPVGKNVAEVLGRSDWVIELDLTPNRGDCLSVIGVAREVAAALEVSSKVPSVEGEGPMDGGLRVSIKDSDGCPRYVLRLVDGVQSGPSPIWMRSRLEAGGLRSINTLVDVTNYVLLEWGQPMHAFDRDKVKGTIQIRRAEAGEVLACLDEVERKLSADDLVIADDEGVIAVAGVIGGTRTAIDEKTTAVLLESAYFDPRSVRMTARRFGVKTDASYRFERGVDPLATWSAANRAVELFTSVAGGRGISGVDGREKPIVPKKLHLRGATLKRILGEELPKAGEYLARLGLSVEKMGDGWQVEVPTRRSDLEREIDLVEEVARMHGYDRFPSALPPIDEEPKSNLVYEQIERLKDILCAAGLTEARGYGFADEKAIERFPVDEVGEPIRLANPLSGDMAFMRRSLIPELLSIWKTNASRQLEGIRLFEIGTLFGKQRTAGATPAHEETHLALLFGGNTQLQQWHQAPREADFFDAKGLIEYLAQKMGWGPIALKSDAAPGYFHPGQSAGLLWRGKSVGSVGLLHPRIARELEVGTVVLADIHLEMMIASPIGTARYKSISAFPIVRRDLAFIVKKSVSAEEVVAEVKKLRDPLLQNIEIFDIYEGRGVAKNSKSVAYRLTFGAADRTLRDEEIDGSVKKAVAVVKQKLGAELRA